jgi:hypothetical protein
MALGPHPQRELTLTLRLGFALPRLGMAAGALHLSQQKIHLTVAQVALHDREEERKEHREEEHDVIRPPFELRASRKQHRRMDHAPAAAFSVNQSPSATIGERTG